MRGQASLPFSEMNMFFFVSPSWFFEGIEFTTGFVFCRGLKQMEAKEQGAEGGGFRAGPKRK